MVPYTVADGEEAALTQSRPWLQPALALAGAIVAPSQDLAAELEGSAVSFERLAVRVGDLNLLCSPMMVREIVAPLPTIPFPHTDVWLVGVANVRGTLVPVIDLRLAFGMEAARGRHQYLLISGAGDDVVGLLVDGLPVLMTFDADALLHDLPPHPDALRGHLRGAYEYVGLVWFDMALESLLASFAAMTAD